MEKTAYEQGYVDALIKLGWEDKDVLHKFRKQDARGIAKERGVKGMIPYGDDSLGNMVGYKRTAKGRKKVYWDHETDQLRDD